MSRMIGNASRARRFANIVLALIPLLFLVTVFWKPALFDHKSLINGDSIVHGLALVDLQAQSFRHLGQLLWSDKIYGGHPLFAEGQGAFANPLNLLVGWGIAPVFGSIYAMNFFHFLAMMLTGAGVIGLCRSLGASWAACSFASVAVVFASIWLGAEQNLTISGALAWVPWTFWAMDRWLKEPSFLSAFMLGGAVALLILSGYPQAFHGTVMYMAIGLLAMPFQPDIRREWRRTWRQRLSSGVVAVLFCTSLSAVQWLPLLELTRLSHRSGGISIHYNLPPVSYFRGMLLTWQGEARAIDYFPGTGSLLVTALASLALVVRLPSRVKGHLLPTIFVVQMGFERGSPLFRVLYDHDLVPGLIYFRTVHIYINIAIIGMAVLAAFAIDGISRWSDARLADTHPFAPPLNRIRIWAAISVVLLWVWIAVRMNLAETRMVCLAVMVGAAIGATLLLAFRRGPLIPFLMIALLVAECLSLRAHTFHFYGASYAGKPASVAAIERVDGWRDYKLFDRSIAAGYGLTDSRSPALPSQMQRVMESVSAMTNLMWGLSSFNAALALPLRRQVEAERLIREEIDGYAVNAAGCRLVDLLAVRFIAVDQASNAVGFRPFWSNPATATQIVENTAALPRFQLYTHHITVDSLDTALEAIGALKAPVLVIENPSDAHQAEPRDSDDASAVGEPPATFDVLKAKSTEYRIDVRTSHLVWFFVADANYPGWKATLDGKPTPLFSAQLLGKAVAVPQGKHRLEIKFESATFRYGLSVSLASIVVALFLSVRRRWGAAPVLWWNCR